MSATFFGIATRTYHYDRTLGRSGMVGGASFRCIEDLAVGIEGRIYVVSKGYGDRSEGLRVTMLTMDEEYVGQFSRAGEGDGELIWPASIAIDSEQNVYISDDWLNRISIFDKDGEFLGKWGVPGSGDGQLNKPAGIEFDKEDNLLLVDSGNNRVQKFTKDGKFLAKWGEAGRGPGQFNLPYRLTIDNRGDVYVADWRNDRIQKFTADGQFLAEYGSSGNGFGEFNRPTDVAVDKDGDIYVADWLNDRVQVLTPDGRHVTTFTGDATMSKWGHEQLNANPDMAKQRDMMRREDLDQITRFARPKAVEIDHEGRIIIADSNRARLQVYKKDNH